MNLAYNYQLIPDLRKVKDMERFIAGSYWENDVWNLNDPFWDDYSIGKKSFTSRRITFFEYPHLFRLEMKYYLATRLLRKTLNPSSLWSDYQFMLKKFVCFLQEAYPQINSFSEISIDEMVPAWLNYVALSGRKSSRQGYRAQIYQLYLFFSDFYDTRDEYEKDIWDCRKIPSVDIPVHAVNHLINFTFIPAAFQRLAKKYIKTRLVICALSTVRLELEAITYFLQFIAEVEPTWTSLRHLTRRYIEDFIQKYLNAFPAKTRRQLDKLLSTRNFLLRIQQFDYPEAPLIPVPSLFFHEDIPLFGTLPPKSERIKYIPDGVMAQLKENLEFLTPSEHIPVVIILIASGWRISDVLNLRYDTCLEYTEQGWYLKGDIRKTRTIGHRIPISDEVKAVVESVAQIAQQKSTETNNPRHLLFNRYSGSRMGMAPDPCRISEALNKLARNHNIVDDQGNPYHFRLHAFRHTKGVELINNGMSLVHVQKWMAHMSPEMTLVYAKVLDTTLRKSWEQAVKNGLFKITSSGQLKQIDISGIENEDLIEWEYIRYNLDAVRMPLGFCMKPKKQDCFTQLNPCLTCRNLCTTPDFLPQYEHEIQETKLLIERGKVQGREVWVEKNQHLLERYEKIVSILRSGQTRHLAGKKGREYIGEERKNVN